MDSVWLERDGKAYFFEKREGPGWYVRVTIFTRDKRTKLLPAKLIAAKNIKTDDWVFSETEIEDLTRVAIRYLFCKDPKSSLDKIP